MSQALGAMEPATPVGLLQQRWAATLLHALTRAGLRDLVISPGSRSSPLVWAAATANPPVHCHDVLDERSAGFFALGRAKATGTPTALLCTSGSAPAHYFPAVIEASQAFVPLVILSADRPSAEHGCGANQTVDQARLFGVHVRHFADLGDPTGDARNLHAAARKALQAMAVATGATPGPVHLNVPFEKPFLAEVSGQGASAERSDVVEAAQWFPPEVRPGEPAIGALVEACRNVHRGLIACGPMSLNEVASRQALLHLAEQTKFPIWADPASQMRFVGDRSALLCADAYDAFLRSEAALKHSVPELVLQFGAAPVSASFERFITSSGASARRFVITPFGWEDPWDSAAALVRAPVGATASAVASRLPERRSGAWQAWMGEINRETWSAIDGLLDQTDGHLTEGVVAREAVEALPSGGLLSLGNSLAIRQVVTFAPGRHRDLLVLSQRGASGIDGLLSSTCGAAIALNRPALLLLGDVSLLHDLAGLALAQRVRTPLAVLVAHNGGGRIFERLPVAHQVSPEHLEHWTTPHGIRFGHAAQMFGHHFESVSTRSDLRRTLAAALRRDGCTLIEADLPRDGGRAEERALEIAMQNLGTERPPPP